MSTIAPSEPTIPAASARRAISMRPSVPTARKICSSLPRPVIRAVASANAPIAVTTPSPAIVPQSAARLLRLRPCTTKTETAMTPRQPKIVATSGSLPPRSAGTTARRNTATLDASPASAARPRVRRAGRTGRRRGKSPGGDLHDGPEPLDVAADDEVEREAVRARADEFAGLVFAVPGDRRMRALARLHVCTRELRGIEPARDLLGTGRGAVQDRPG